MAVAEKYMKLAGFPSGKYTGSKTIKIVGATGGPAAEDAEIVNQTLKNLGFKTKLALVDQSVMYAKYCGVPKEEIDVCPSVGWIADFADPQTVLNVTVQRQVHRADQQLQLGSGRTTRRSTPRWTRPNGRRHRRARDAWAKIDDELVEDAAAIP